ncbi:hypothetical protein SAMN05421780_11052 [Flexibacter flexilis DSM 6793]|uniref:Late embryogenesis abundant protein n=1 Tax=Flexibacter flexilis DSM 6793 TaxID=927664 RepID=A0A1I1M8C0_9BACT|nr:hypothetical protein [Flexibacter flexilis]SFC81012.1 hypothetical protein SAMN05421780_11052 [Flexibacter flexilis DSM 6793]
MKKTWLWIGSILGLGFLAVKAGGYLNLGNEIVVETSSSFSGTLFGGLTIKTNVIIKNPTLKSIQISYPFVRVLTAKKDGAELGTSNANPTLITIPASAQIQSPNDFPTFEIKMPLTTLLASGTAIWNAIKSGTVLVIATSFRAIVGGVAVEVPTQYEELSVKV